MSAVGTLPARRAMRGSLVATVALLLGLALAGPALGGQTGSPTPQGVAVRLTATPTEGAVPLLVAFTASVNASAPLWMVWSFGDGAYWNGTSADHLNVSHWYLAAGTYSARVSVSNGVAGANATVTIVAGPNPLAVTAHANTTAGSPPLAVLFTVSPRGGSETYDAYLWAFGDGTTGSGLEVVHVYHSAGSFRATVTVRDSLNATATASIWVNVTDGPPSPVQWAVGGTMFTWVAAGVGLGGALIAGVLVLGRRRPAAPGPVDYLQAGPRDWTPRDPTVEGPPAHAAERERTVPITSAVAPPTGGGVPGRTMSPAPPTVLAEARRTSQEILLRLLAIGPLPRDGLPGPDRTQGGLASDLGIRQSTLSAILRRLLAAGAISVETRHVRGEGRRLRVYQLTARGEAIARDLRKQRAGRGSRNAPPEP